MRQKCFLKLKYHVAMACTVSMTQLCTCSAGGGQIDTLVLVDRTIDPLTPLCTQLTYEGLVDETLHIKNGVVQLGAEGKHIQACSPTKIPADLLACSLTLSYACLLVHSHIHTLAHTPTQPCTCTGPSSGARWHQEQNLIDSVNSQVS